MDQTVLSMFGQMLAAILDSMAAAKSTVNLMTEEVQLNVGGACFAVMDSNIQVTSINPDRTLLLDSAVSALPASVLSQFRTVSIATPDVILLMEILLQSQGIQCYKHFINFQKFINVPKFHHF